MFFQHIRHKLSWYALKIFTEIEKCGHKLEFIFTVTDRQGATVHAS